MVFSSYVFVFLFLPVSLITYFLLSRIGKPVQHLFLVLASLFFYGFFNFYYLFIILASIIVNYILAKFMVCVDKFSKLALIIGIIFNIGMLGYYKYYDFFISNVNLVFGSDFTLRHILLPLGISFFTFQQFSFLLSVYKKGEHVENFIDYCLFVSFFPQLIAGPIVLYGEMIPQFTNEKNRYVNFDNIAKGFYMFTIGLFKKIVIADTLALFVNNGFEAESLGLAASWITSLSYTMQIYFDFSGYSDMAIGLGKMFNINIAKNFVSPYKSTGIAEFWRRWHITLGRALSTYIYIPLGGNRKGAFRTYINLFLTFLISGLWHGAAWTFVIWGIAHGLCSMLERIFKNYLSKIPRLIRIAVTFLIVNFLWIIFRATDFLSAKKVFSGMFNFKNIGLSQIEDIVFDGWVNFPTAFDIMYVLTILVVLCFVVFHAKNSLERFDSFSPNTKNLIFTIGAFCLSVIHMSRESVFIYFNF